ncbi:hypothetical protein QYF61_007981 [Mycteria americana]|uniref:Uncharacterized protein n=1 Tax=Mycteria americana TaxID=33587 RepID=A0AAN7S2U4_MYCAM|nr:hypothetical protein QYF61_007981 [Mycteria americana]
MGLNESVQLEVRKLEGKMKSFLAESSIHKIVLMNAVASLGLPNHGIRRKRAPSWRQHHARLVRVGGSVIPQPRVTAAVAEADGQSPRLLARYSSARDRETASLSTAKPVATVAAWAAPRAGVGGVRQHLSTDFQKTLSQTITLLSLSETKQQEQSVMPCQRVACAGPDGESKLLKAGCVCVVSCASERGDGKADLLAEIPGGVERVTLRRELPGAPGEREHSHCTLTTRLILAAKTILSPIPLEAERVSEWLRDSLLSPAFAVSSLLPPLLKAGRICFVVSGQVKFAEICKAMHWLVKPQDVAVKDIWSDTMACGSECFTSLTPPELEDCPVRVTGALLQLTNVAGPGPDQEQQGADESGIQQAGVVLTSQSTFLPHRPPILANFSTVPVEKIGSRFNLMNLDPNRPTFSLHKIFARLVGLAEDDPQAVPSTPLSFTLFTSWQSLDCSGAAIPLDTHTHTHGKWGYGVQPGSDLPYWLQIMLTIYAAAEGQAIFQTPFARTWGPSAQHARSLEAERDVLQGLFQRIGIMTPETSAEVWSNENLPSVEEEQVREYLNKLDTQKSNGYDGMDPKLLTELADVILRLLISTFKSTISQNILIEKPLKYRLDKWTVRLIENWLNCWDQRFVITGVNSSWSLVTSRVPQRSILVRYCLTSSLMTWMMRPTTPSASLPI